jgi:hypothetical protein
MRSRRDSPTSHATLALTQVEGATIAAKPPKLRGDDEPRAARRRRTARRAAATEDETCR